MSLLPCQNHEARGISLFILGFEWTVPQNAGSARIWSFLEILFHTLKNSFLLFVLWFSSDIEHLNARRESGWPLDSTYWNHSRAVTKPQFSEVNREISEYEWSCGAWAEEGESGLQNIPHPLMFCSGFHRKTQFTHFPQVGSKQQRSYSE